MIRCTHFHTSYLPLRTYCPLLVMLRRSQGFLSFPLFLLFRGCMYSSHFHPPSSILRGAERREKGFLSCQVGEKKHKTQRHTPFALAFAMWRREAKKNPIPSLAASSPAAREGGGEGRINPAECFFSLQERGRVPPSRLQPHFVTFYTNSVFRSFFCYERRVFSFLGGHFRSEASLHPSLQSFFP